MKPQALTERQLQLLRLLACGCTNKEAAVAMGISASTVKNHCTNLCDRLRVQGRLEAVVRGLELGLLAATDLHVRKLPPRMKWS